MAAPISANVNKAPAQTVFGIKSKILAINSKIPMVILPISRPMVIKI